MNGYHSKQAAASVMQGAIRVAFQDAAARILKELSILEKQGTI